MALEQSRAIESIDELKTRLTQLQTVEIEDESRPAMVAESLLRVYL
ncbi:MAG: hypothetical protein JOY61_25280 [Chloroflexi bacterium]|nr:hypothetical protein [Chloroflexota bacterium]